MKRNHTQKEQIARNKLRAEINKIETKKIQKFNKQRVGSLIKISKIDKPLSKLTKRQRENIQINRIRNERETYQQTPWETRESWGHTLKTCTSSNWKNLKEIDNFLDRQHLPKLN